MKITCQKCNSVYSIDASKIPAGGAPATCKKCGNKFRVAPPAPSRAMPESAPPPIPKNTTDSVPEPPIPGAVSVDAKERERGLKPLGRLTKLLRVLLILNIALIIVAVLAGLYEYHIYENLPLGTDINEVLLPSDVLVGIVGMAQLVLFVILGTTFLCWIYRANKNLRELSGKHMDYTPGWSVGWYFVPIANLFKPFQAMKEIWEVSHNNQDDSSAILVAWWILWLISNFIGEMTFKSVMAAESIAEHTSTTMIYLASDSLDVVLNIVALMLVSRIWAAYSKNYNNYNRIYKGAPIVNRPVKNPHGLVGKNSIASDLHSSLL